MANQDDWSSSLDELIDAFRRRIVVLFAGDEANADLWLRTPNRHLAGGVPLDMIQGGEEDRQAMDLLVGAMEDRIPN